MRNKKKGKLADNYFKARINLKVEWILLILAIFGGILSDLDIDGKLFTSFIPYLLWSSILILDLLFLILTYHKVELYSEGLSIRSYFRIRDIFYEWSEIKEIEINIKTPCSVRISLNSRKKINCFTIA